MVYTTELKNEKDVLRLNKEATKQLIKILVESGSITVDAKSILALYALIGKSVKLIAPDHADSDEFREFIKRIKL